MKFIEVVKNNKIRKVLLLENTEKEIRKKVKDELEKYNIVSSNVYSFTKGKSAKMAVEKIKTNIDYYKYFIKIDIKNYYNSINIDKLYNILKLYINDESLLDKVISLVNEERKTMNINRLAIGSPLSNILSNIYLSSVDNKYLNSNEFYVRFCDDIFMLSDNTDVFNELKNDINKLDLTINERKTIMGKSGEKVKFLGFYINKPDKVSEAESYLYRILNLGESYEDIIDKLIEEHKYSLIEEINELRIKYDGSDSLINRLINIFSITEKGYYISELNGTKDYKYIDSILDTSVIRKHLNGEISLAVSLAREDDKSNVVVIDIDSKDYNFKKIEESFKNNNIYYYKEFSGMKGYHYWLFFDKFYNIENINKMILKLKEEYFNDIPIEIIPKYESIDEGEKIIKLPYGLHPVNKNKSYFIGDGLEEKLYLNKLKENEEAFNNFLEDFQIKFPEGKKLIDNCSVIKQIIKDGIIEKEMCHYKRLILLYVIKFLDNGAEMLHYIFENMNNYSFNITERNIDKSFSNPISCEKIKSYIKDENNIIKCNCNKYVSCPLIKVDSDKFSGILYKEEMKNIIEKIIKLKDERKSINRNITILENKLEKIFNLSGDDEANIEMGKLKRKDGKWVIEMEI